MLGIRSVPVKEMLGIVNHLGVPREVFDTLSNHREVFFEADTQNFCRMVVPGFSHHRDARSLCGDQCAQSGILRSDNTSSSRHAESAKASPMERSCSHPLKELLILRIGVWKASFNQVDSDLRQPLRDVDLVEQRKTDSFRLSSVAQGGVIDRNRFHFQFA